MSQDCLGYSGVEFTRKLAEALGLKDVPIQSITIVADCSGRYPQVWIKKGMIVEEEESVSVLMSNYKLVEIEPDVTTS